MKTPTCEPAPDHETPGGERSPSDPAQRVKEQAEWFHGSAKVQVIALVGLFLYSSLWVLYIAKAILLPVVFALILSLLLAPIMRGLRNVRIPAPLAAGGILILVATGLAAGLLQLASPASFWLDHAPEALDQVERKFQTVKDSILEMGKATQALEKMTKLPEIRTPPEVEVKTDSLGTLLVNWTTEFMIALIATMVLLYFFLASGDLFLEKLVKVLPGFAEKRRAVEIVRDIERQISGYLLTVTGVNISLAVVVSLAMYLWGMPNPLLWGAMAGMLNFIPYVGSFIGLGAMTLAAAFTFEHPSMVAMVAGTYLMLTALEGNFLTPHVLGHKMALNPVVVLVSVLFWGWLWGAVGALLAVPLTASFKIIFDQIPSLSPLGEFLGR